MAEVPGFTERGFILKASDSVHGNENQIILNRLATLVGCVCIGLPIIMILGSTLGESCFRDSLSHYYHAQFLGGFFVGLLFFIGGFLLAYSGDHVIETYGSSIAGIGAIGVALFPTSGSGCELKDNFLSRVFVNVSDSDAGYIVNEMTRQGQSFFDLFGDANGLHSIGAGIVFIYLGLFCICVLRRVIPEIHGMGEDLLETKRKRNTIYFWCGVLILSCVAALLLKNIFLGDLVVWHKWNLTFWIESLALWAFGLAWTIKGRIFNSLND